MALTNFEPLLSGLGRFQSQSGGAPAVRSSPKEIGQGFESLLIRQFLSAARSGALESSDQQESGWLEMADDAMAGFLASRGGLGLAGQVASLLEQGRHRSSQSSSDLHASPLAPPVDTPNESRLTSLSSSFNISGDPAVVSLGATGLRSHPAVTHDAVTTQWDNQR